MKKVLFFLLLCLTWSGAAYGAVEPADLKFTQDTGGNYIYCNNHEFLRRQDLSDTSNPDATYIMNNPALQAGKYAMFVSHVNHTELRDDQGQMTAPGFDIELDVHLKARQDTTLTITAMGFEVPAHSLFYQDGVPYPYGQPWGCLHAWADYKQLPLYEIDSATKYLPRKFAPLVIRLKAGEEMWLSKYIPNYTEVPLWHPVHLLADFTIQSGSADINIAALRATGTLGDRSQHSPTAKVGTYQRDSQYKGVADALNSVSANLEYTIDDNVWSGSLLPVRVYNQYKPEGNTVTQWTTHINPQADAWAKAACPESDMLSFHYEDGTKGSFYGSGVPEGDRDPVWHFDTTHSDAQAYPGSQSGFTPRKYVPNAPLTPGKDGFLPCNLGNYGVSLHYNMSITNAGARMRYLNYRLATASNNIVILRDEGGNLIHSYGLCKGEHPLKERDTMACVPLPAGQTTNFSIEVILPTNYAGGMENTLEINDVPTVINLYDNPRTETMRPKRYTGREYIKWDKGTLHTSPDGESWTPAALPPDTKKLFEGIWNHVDLLYTGDGYVAKPNLYDGVPYYTVQDFYRTVYLLDEQFRIVAQHSFSAYPSAMTYAKGVFYVWAGSPYRSTDFHTWTLTDVFPLDNNGPFALALQEGGIALSPDGDTFVPVAYEAFTPPFVETVGDVYYTAKGDTLYLSQNGLDWTPIPTEETVSSVAPLHDQLVINQTEPIPLPAFGDNIAVRTKDAYLGFATPPVTVGDTTFVPLSFLARQLGANLIWLEQDQTALVYTPQHRMVLKVGADTAWQDGASLPLPAPLYRADSHVMVPLRFLAEALGFQVRWEEASRSIVVHTDLRLK